MRMLRSHSTGSARDSSGFTLAEILVVIAIIAILAAVAIPILVQQRSNAADVSSQSALRSTATVIEERLAADGGVPPDGQLNICHASATYPVDPGPANTCAAGTWSATVASTNLAVSPTLSGTVQDDVFVQGVIAADGSYCLQATSQESGAGIFSITDTDPDPSPQTCIERAWAPPTGVLGTAADTSISDLPDAPAGVSVSNPTTTTIEVSWTAEANTTYQINVTGQPIKTYTAGSTGGTATCLFPADTCDGVATGNLYGGDYTASVRAQGTNGWSPGSLVDFTHPLP